MSTGLETARHVWDVIRNGSPVDASGPAVSVLPQGATPLDLEGWQGPVCYPETYDDLSFIFESDFDDFTITPSWQFNGRYISNFSVRAEGPGDVQPGLDVSVTTLEALVNPDEVVELPYLIKVSLPDANGGVRRRTYRGLARGNGSVLSLR